MLTKYTCLISEKFRGSNFHIVPVENFAHRRIPFGGHYLWLQKSLVFMEGLEKSEFNGNILGNQSMVHLDDF